MSFPTIIVRLNWSKNRFYRPWKNWLLATWSRPARNRDDRRALRTKTLRVDNLHNESRSTVFLPAFSFRALSRSFSYSISASFLRRAQRIRVIWSMHSGRENSRHAEKKRDAVCPSKQVDRTANEEHLRRETFAKDARNVGQGKCYALASMRFIATSNVSLAKIPSIQYALQVGRMRITSTRQDLLADPTHRNCDSYRSEGCRVVHSSRAVAAEKWATIRIA